MSIVQIDGEKSVNTFLKNVYKMDMENETIIVKIIQWLVTLSEGTWSSLV